MRSLHLSSHSLGLVDTLLLITCWIFWKRRNTERFKAVELAFRKKLNKQQIQSFWYVFFFFNAGAWLQEKEVSFCGNSLGTKQPCVRKTDATSKNVLFFFCCKRAATLSMSMGMVRSYFRVFIVVTFWPVLISNARCVATSARKDRRTGRSNAVTRTMRAIMMATWEHSCAYWFLLLVLPPFLSLQTARILWVLTA